MSNMTKGQETKNKIRKTARALFYEQGYNNTTSRQISENSGTNLGLLKYYFNGKNEIAQIIYTDIRNHCDQLLLQEEFGGDEKQNDSSNMFLLSSAIELYLCLENKNYARFYNEIINEPLIRANIQNIISEVLIKYSKKQENSDYVKLASLSISSIKPALVSYVYDSQNPIATEVCIRYYLEQQLHFLGEERQKVEELIGIINKYYINIVNMFTPVMTKIIT
jgi:AcrR family transcriptional regulator